MLPAQPNQSLIEGLAVLQAVSASVEPVGSRELARRLGLEPTRVNRLLKTLAALGLAAQDEERKYGPGPGLHVLAATALVGSKLLSKSVAPVEALRAEVPALTVALGVRWRREVAYLLHVSPGRALAEGVGRVGLFPAERSSIGQVLLAGAEPAELRAVYEPAELDESRRGSLLQALSAVRRKGYALVEGAAEPTLAVPVGPIESATSALAVAGRFSAAEVPKLVESLRRAADAIHSH